MCDGSPGDARLEVGATGYPPQVRGSTVDPAAELLSLGLAFEALPSGRVQLTTDVSDVRFQRAVARPGSGR